MNSQPLLGAGPWTELRRQAAFARFQLAHTGEWTLSGDSGFIGRVLAQFDTELSLEDLENSPNAMNLTVEVLHADFVGQNLPTIGDRFTFPSGLIVELSYETRRHDVSSDWLVRLVNEREYL